ncbi:3-deoxy-manno-octulosonate cytidylyltransferase [Synechococcus sp. KORDI-52]|uniref:3-deoxy-manno-octulosonate cytidylyltransferase n=1 Tax=Synechococcus sp. KORDI-52 TaxID=585425 RepID=UPI0008FFB020|nr:3-deoxy-manno-octulosonate cytidylyltransferase [Synechococcus sp. KORDI-52]
MSTSKKCVGLIPSRLSSTRLPGKALADIAGMPLVVHTAKRALLSKSLTDVFVCTDSDKIADTCAGFGIKVIKTSSGCINGTERIAQAANSLNDDFFIDIQGDEPLIDPSHIDAVVDCLINLPSQYDIVLPVLKVPYTASDSIVRVQISNSNRVMTLSRANIPHIYNKNPQHIYKHLSIIGFSKRSLELYSNLSQSHNEIVENVELLRALENDMSILALPLNGDSFSVDLQDDLDRARLAMTNDPYYGKY